MITSISCRVFTDDHPIMDLGLIGPYGMRKSLQDGTPLLNNRNTYQRKVYIRLLDSGEDNDETRLAGLNVIKDFLSLECNNKYQTEVFIQDPGWDITPPGETLPKSDMYIEYNDIVKMINDMFPNVDHTWAAANMEAAMCFFHENHIPTLAIADLGFPVGVCSNNDVYNG